jgi:DNA-binding transcriptional ArsR family regulator
MSENNFLLVDLNDPKTKKLAETITSATSRKILNSLAQQDSSETKLSETLSLPLSTVHYHLEKLKEAGLVTIEEFRYSKKGREINQYKLAKKYILIAPHSVETVWEKIKDILPLVGAAVVMSGIIKLIQWWNLSSFQTADTLSASVPSASMMKESSLSYAPQLITPTPDFAIWFFLGSMAIIGVYALRLWLKKK